MKYLNITKDKWVEVDETKDTATVFIASELIQTKSEFQERLKELPQAPSDEELLKWAKEHYPSMNYQVEKEYLETKISKINDICSAIKSVEDVK